MIADRAGGPALIAVRSKQGLVLRRGADGLDVLAAADGHRLRTVPIDGLITFAAVAEEAWAFADESLIRVAIQSGLELGRSRLPWAPDGYVVAAPSELSAVIGRDERLAWIRIEQRMLQVVEIPPELAATYGTPLTARSIVVGNQQRAWTIGANQPPAPFPLPADVEVADIRVALGGSVLCLIGTAATPCMIVVRSNGSVVHRIPLADRVRRVAIADDRGIAAAILSTGEIVAVDLRYGKLLSSWQPREGVDDIAISGDGSMCLSAREREGGEVVIEGVGADAPIAREPDRDGEPLADEAPVSIYRTLGIALPDATPEVELPWPELAPAGKPMRDRAELRAAARALLEDALCHATLLLERLFFLNRNLGLLPRTSTAEDPMGSLVITDSDVNTIVAGFRKIGLTKPEARPGLLQDPFEDRVIASRKALREAIMDERSSECGLARIVHAFKLDEAMTDLLVLALCPDWDMRMGKLIGFLNNDATQQRPRMGHLLMTAEFGLPAPDVEVYSRAQAALFDTRLLRREATASTPVMGQAVRADDQVVELSLTSLDRDEVSEGRLWSELRWSEQAKRHLRVALRRELTRDTGQRLVILEGIRGSGRMAMCQAIARELGFPLELCDLSASDHATTPEIVQMISRAVLRARVCGRMLVIRSEGVLRKHEGVMPGLAGIIKVHGIHCFLLVRPAELEAIDSSLGFVRLEPPKMTREDRRKLWLERLTDLRLEIRPEDLDDVAARYDCPPGRVEEICSELQFRRDGKGSAQVEIADVRDTLRDLTVQRLRSLAKRYESSISLSDLLFPVAVVERLEELVHRLRHRHKVLSGWAFADKAHESYGVSALFVGPPGTGKTAAAAAIANAMHIDLYIVDFSSIMSKWVGETEQNLAKIFDEAEASSVALLFDEADALFGKRSAEQTSSSDRYANLTINYLLQRMESFSGLAMLTTNLESAMDEAFQRRITCKVRFPETDEELRVKLWTHMLPGEATYADDVDLQVIAAGHEMQGAHIRRALTRAAFRAAAKDREQPVLTQEDLMWSAMAEYEDMGRLTFGGQQRPERSDLDDVRRRRR